MARKKTGGRQKGSKNKVTREREAREKLERDRLAEIERLDVASVTAAIGAAHTVGVKLAKDVLADFMRLYAGMAAAAQPLPPGVIAPPGYKPDPAAFEKWSTLAVDAATRLAPFQSPRFSAVMIGATTVNKIEVVGGLPDEEDGSLNPGGLIIEGHAEPEPEALPLPKVVNE